MPTSACDQASVPGDTRDCAFFENHTKAAISLKDILINLPGDTVVSFVPSETVTQCEAEFMPGNTGTTPSSRWSRFCGTTRSILKSSKSEQTEFTVPSSLFIRVPKGIHDMGSMRFDCKGTLQIEGTNDLFFNVFDVDTTGNLGVGSNVKAERAGLKSGGTMECKHLDAKSHRLKGSAVEVDLVYPGPPGFRSTINGKYGVRATISAPKVDQTSSPGTIQRTAKVPGIVDRLFEVVLWAKETWVNGEQYGQDGTIGWPALVQNPCQGQLYITSGHGPTEVSFPTGSEPRALLVPSKG